MTLKSEFPLDSSQSPAVWAPSIHPFRHHPSLLPQPLLVFQEKHVRPYLHVKLCAELLEGVRLVHVTPTVAQGSSITWSLQAGVMGWWEGGGHQQGHSNSSEVSAVFLPERAGERGLGGGVGGRAGMRGREGWDGGAAGAARSPASPAHPTEVQLHSKVSVGPSEALPGPCLGTTISVLFSDG